MFNSVENIKPITVCFSYTQGSSCRVCFEDETWSHGGKGKACGRGGFLPPLASIASLT